MTVLRRREADGDLDAIAEYIGQHNPAAAVRFLEAAKVTFSLLARFPRAGSKLVAPHGRVSDLRRITVNRFGVYVVYYSVDHHIEVVRVLHSARDRDALLWDEF